MSPKAPDFEELMSEVERRVVSALAEGQVEADPVKGLKIADNALKAVLGRPDTNATLALLSTIDDIGDHDVAGMYSVTHGKVACVVKDCLNAAVDRRLEAVRKSAVARSFATGFLRCAERMMSLAEEAAAARTDIIRPKLERVSEARASLKKIAAEVGKPDDLLAVFDLVYLLRDLIATPDRKNGTKIDGPDIPEIESAITELKAYRATMGFRWWLYDDALAAISRSYPPSTSVAV